MFKPSWCVFPLNFDNENHSTKDYNLIPYPKFRKEYKANECPLVYFDEAAYLEAKNAQLSPEKKIALRSSEIRENRNEDSIKSKSKINEINSQRNLLEENQYHENVPKENRRSEIENKNSQGRSVDDFFDDVDEQIDGFFNGNNGFETETAYGNGFQANYPDNDHQGIQEGTMGFENLENQMESQKMGFSGSIAEGKIAEAQVHDNISDDDEVIDFIDLVTGAVSYFPLTVVQICGVFLVVVCVIRVEVLQLCFIVRK